MYRRNIITSFYPDSTRRVKGQNHRHSRVLGSESVVLNQQIQTSPPLTPFFFFPFTIAGHPSSLVRNQ